jgi:hypothetical protein
MKSVQVHPPSLLAGCLLAGLAFLSMSQSPVPAAQVFEYKIAVDVNDKELAKLAGEGWEFAGYLGQSSRGVGTDETLWKRPSK